MSGALVDLVAIGIQNAFITGNPQVSFFRSNYKRFVNFSLQPAKLDVVGQGNDVIVRLDKKGDLLTSVWVDVSTLAADAPALSLRITKLVVLSATTGTITYTTASRLPILGDTFTITGWDNATYNGTYTVTAPGGTSTACAFTKVGGSMVPTGTFYNDVSINITNSKVTASSPTECTVTYPSIVPPLENGESIVISGHTGTPQDVAMDGTFAVGTVTTGSPSTAVLTKTSAGALTSAITISIANIDTELTIDITLVVVGAGGGVAGTATMTPLPNGRIVRVGEEFTVTTAGASYDGVITVTDTVTPDATTFTFTNTITMPAGPSGALTGGSIATLTSAGTVTLYTNTGAERTGDVEVGEEITVTGMAPPELNGTYTVSALPTPTVSTFSFTSSAAVSAAAVTTGAGGTGNNDGIYNTGNITGIGGVGTPLGVYDATSNINVTQIDTPTEFSLYIGNKMIDRQDGFFINTVWPKCLATNPTKALQPENAGSLFFPLHFFHCDNYETPIPLVALQNQTAEIQVKYSPHSTPGVLDYWAEYVQLDTEERKWFTNNTHNLLITQMQKVVASSTGSDLCYLNHPVKSIMWGTSVDGDTFQTTDVQLSINGVDIFRDPMPYKYFNTVQRYQHTDNTVDYGTNDTIHMFSFGESANKIQPTGSCNFSRLDDAKVQWTSSGTPATPTSVYAVNYNVLTVKNGSAGILFSN